MLWVPTSQAIVAGLAPEDVRGAYMGAFGSTAAARLRARAVHGAPRSGRLRRERRWLFFGGASRWPPRPPARSPCARPIPAAAPPRCPWSGRSRRRERVASASVSSVGNSRLGAVPDRDGTTAFTVCGAGCPGHRRPPRRRVARARARRRAVRRHAPRRPGRGVRLRPRRRAGAARSLLALPAAGHPRAFAGSRRATAGPPSRAEPLDDLGVYELHVGTFSAEGTFDGGDPLPGGAARAGRDRDRADAGRHVPRRPWLGLRRGRRATRRIAPTADRRGCARLVDAAHARGARRGARRGLQPPGAGLGGAGLHRGRT